MSAAVASVIGDEAALDLLVPEWWELWRRRREAPPFLAPAWLMPWWRHFAPGKLFVLASRLDGRLVGLAPSYIEDGPLGRRILPLGISLSDHLDVLADPQCEASALAGLAAAAMSRSQDWDVWELEELQPDAAALRLPLPPGCTDETQHQSPCPLLQLADDPRFPRDFPHGKRRHLNLAGNRAARRGPVRVDKADAEAVPAALEHLFRLHRLRWESRGGSGVLAPDAVQGFQRDAAPGLQDAGLLRLYTLSIADQVVAAHYQMVHGHRSFEYLTGFDPAYDFESLGQILFAHAIAAAAAEGCREVDLLRGSEPYKYQWGAVDRWNVKRSIRQTAHA